MVKAMGHSLRSQDEENFLFLGCGCALPCDMFLVVCRVLCAKAVGSTSSEGFLVSTESIVR